MERSVCALRGKEPTRVLVREIQSQRDKSAGTARHRDTESEEYKVRGIQQCAVSHVLAALFGVVSCTLETMSVVEQATHCN